MCRLVILSAVLGCVFAIPQNYGAPPSLPPARQSGTAGRGGGGSSYGGHGGSSSGVSSGRGSGGHGGSGGGSGGYGGSGGGSIKMVPCSGGKVLQVDGSCVVPVVTRSVFLYNAPPQPVTYVPPPKIPPPKVDYNFVIVRTPEIPKPLAPIVVPPPQKKTLVYVLNKNMQVEGQQVIEVPSGPKQSPEVFYVNYNEGENPSLPGGVSLQEALSVAKTKQGQAIESGFGGGMAAYGVGNSGGGGGGGMAAYGIENSGGGGMEAYLVGNSVGGAGGGDLGGGYSRPFEGY